jgi:hypothetical protein
MTDSSSPFQSLIFLTGIKKGTPKLGVPYIFENIFKSRFTFHASLFIT